MSDNLNVNSFFEHEGLLLSKEQTVNKVVEELEHVIETVKGGDVESLQYTVCLRAKDSSGVDRGFISETAFKPDDLQPDSNAYSHQVLEFNGVREQVLRLHNELIHNLSMSYCQEVDWEQNELREVTIGRQEPIFVSLDKVKE